MNKTIFVVDDNAVNLSIAKDSLKDHYRVRTLPSAAKLFDILNKITPDLILLDIEMPEIDGFEALKILKEKRETENIPVIFLTSLVDSNIEAKGFQMGVIDFINKPFSIPVLLNRIKTHLNIDEIIRERTDQLHQKNQVLEKLQNALVFVLADMVENRDKETGGHVERTTFYIKKLAEVMVANNVYKEELKNIDIDLLTSSARLHDIGKITISDTILNKTGKLTDEEFEIMKSHCVAGVQIIDSIISRTDNVEFLHTARLIAESHHERWDGKGYPYGLAGEDIPIQGRMMAIVDVYDALISERPYKKAFSHEEAVNIIIDSAGTQFDPIIADAFYKSKDLFKNISE